MLGFCVSTCFLKFIYFFNALFTQSLRGIFIDKYVIIQTNIDFIMIWIEPLNLYNRCV